MLIDFEPTPLDFTILYQLHQMSLPGDEKSHDIPISPGSDCAKGTSGSGLSTSSPPGPTVAVSRCSAARPSALAWYTLVLAWDDVGWTGHGDVRQGI